MKIIVGGVVSLPPFSAGIAWDWIQYSVGLRELGHDVYFVEEVMPEWCFDNDGQSCDFLKSANRELFRAIMERFGFWEKACQVFNHGEATCGLPFSSFIAETKDAELLINMSGHVTTEAILGNVNRRVYVDQDPVYTQLWHSEYGKDLNFGKHDVFFTVGLNIGTPHTDIPDCGVTWHHVLPPVALEYWAHEFDATCTRFSTIASWSGFNDLSYRGEWYKSKYAEFQRFAALPTEVDQPLEVILKAYQEHDDGIRLLKTNGWVISEPDQVGDLSGYQQFIARSRAEIGIAQNAYVKGRSGWFSDRAAHYLASGKPALCQSTGFERCLPTGRGLLSFSNMDEAVAGIEAINANYSLHCRSAREFAEEYLGYRKVLPKMLETCGAG